jgi:YHS domain-containing protein
VQAAVPLGPVVDAEWALFHMQRALWDPVDPRRLGSLEDSLQYRVNGEVYRFSSFRTLQRFVHSPELWCGLVRDPVSGRRFLPSARSPECYWVGGPYFFESEVTKDAFVSDPKKYEIIRRM